MSGQPALGARGVMAGVLSAAVDWLVEPAGHAERKGAGGAALRERPVVAVIGGCADPQSDGGCWSDNHRGVQARGWPGGRC